MGQRNRHHNKRPKPHTVSNAPVRAPLAAYEKKAPIEYGKPFTLLEDDQKATYIYKDGQWSRHSLSIAECRVDCQVKQLPQKINGMTRYEICSPVVAKT